MQRKIYILQDCDVDGVFSSVLAYKFLSLIVPAERIQFLYHSDKGHGLTPEIMGQIEPNSFIWIPDAGSNDVEQCKELQEKGCKILITDHHEIEYDNPYAVVINNQVEGVENKFGSGSLVTFKFIQYCCEKFKIKDYLNWIDLVAFANIGDTMSMLPLENRVFSEVGLKHINNDFLKFLCGNLIKGEINPTSIVWSVIPKINALIRGGDIADKEILTKVLLMDYNLTDYEKCYETLLKCHKHQSDFVKSKTQKLLDKIHENNNPDDNVAIAFTEKSAYTGLIANKIMNTENKTTLVVYKQDGKYFGSCRSPFEVKDMMNESGLFEYVLGHQSANGVCFKNPNEIIEFFNQKRDLEFKGYKVIGNYKPSELPKFLFDFASDYSNLWGKDIDEPVIHTHFICKGTDWIELRGSAIKLCVDDVTFIKFFVSKEQKKKWFVGENVQISIDIIGKCQYNEWEDNKYKQVEVKEIEVQKHELNDWSDLF